MKDAEALELVREAVRGAGPAWADLGAGDGIFTRALADLLGSEARIYAVDRARRRWRAWRVARSAGAW
jgi:ubiquinone/menaquinone biosynthesis C-methylase UbiE